VKEQNNAFYGFPISTPTFKIIDVIKSIKIIFLIDIFLGKTIKTKSRLSYQICRFICLFV